MLYNFNALSATQKAQLQQLVNDYADVRGSYASTMLEGIVHGYCDSGILTDALSSNDAELISKYFTETAMDEGHLHAFNSFINAVTGEDLECVKVASKITSICGDEELGAAYIGTLLGTIA